MSRKCEAWQGIRASGLRLGALGYFAILCYDLAMRIWHILALTLMPQTAMACGNTVCLVNPDSLILPQVIDFDDQPSGWGPGVEVDDVLALPGARIGEHFAGQQVSTSGAHDIVTGPAFAPLTVRAGRDGQNLSVVHFSGTTLINGFGAAGYPSRDAQGEGAIAVEFDEDQSALSFELRGGEAGAASVTFLRRDGAILGTVPVVPTGEFTVGFITYDGNDDIAGFVITNTDPQGLAIDTLRFGKPPDIG